MPLDCAEETLVPEAGAGGGNVGDGAYLSRKQLKQASKRAAKLARRQNAVGLRRDDTSVKHPKGSSSAFIWECMFSWLYSLIFYPILPP